MSRPWAGWSFHPEVLVELVGSVPWYRPLNDEGVRRRAWAAFASRPHSLSAGETRHTVIVGGKAVENNG